MSDPEPEPQPQPPPPSPGRTRIGRGVRELTETLLLALVIYLGVQTLIPPYAVEGRSMDPTLQDGERLLVNRSVYAHFDANKLLNLLPGEDRADSAVVYPFHPPERGDIVVFYPPVASDRPYIKRVIGLPGDRVAIAEGQVWINGEPLAEPYLDGARTVCPSRACDLTVPDGEVYLLGDNRNNSSDSRVFGPVSMDEIVGKAWLANWPPEAFGFIPHVDYAEPRP